MPHYKTHAKFNILLALPIMAGALVFFLHPPLGNLLCFSFLFIYATLFMNPDVDLANRTNLFSLKGLLTLPFRSYAYFFHHRGLSHSVWFGTLSRIVWLFLFAALFLYLGNYLFWAKKGFFILLKENTPFFAYGIGGVFFADLFHILLDKVPFRNS